MFKKILNYVRDDKLKISVFKNKVDVINYKEILVFDDNKIVIDCNEVVICIIGTNLVINKLFDRELLVTGNITKIEFR